MSEETEQESFQVIRDKLKVVKKNNDFKGLMVLLKDGACKTLDAHFHNNTEDQDVLREVLEAMRDILTVLIALPLDRKKALKGELEPHMDILRELQNDSVFNCSSDALRDLSFEVDEMIGRYYDGTAVDVGLDNSQEQSEDEDEPVNKVPVVEFSNCCCWSAKTKN
jgi:hypothetical protein